MRRAFDQQLDELNQSMIAMGSLIEEAIENACKALLSRDTELARRVMEGDQVVDRQEREIEAMCLRLLLKQQPIATDLRKVSSALKMITDMERIGDQAADISEIITMESGMDAVLDPDMMQNMAHAAMQMVHSAIDAYVSGDVDLAREVQASDDQVDDLFTQVKQELIQHMSRDAKVGLQALDLLMIAKYYERIADHAVNISEWVEFSITGRYKGEVLS